MSLGEIREIWPLLALADRIQAFLLLPRDEAEDFFFGLPARDQADVVLGVPAREQRSWLRSLPPDDAADLIQAAPMTKREALLALLDEATRREVTALLAYSEDNAGGLMNPRYVRVRPDMTVDEAISYVRKQMRELTRTIYYVFVLDNEQKLMGVVSFSALFNASVRARVADIMRTQVITIPEQMDQETVATKFAQSRLLALPVVDATGRMQGIVTADDVVDVVREEATEDMQKVGGVEALEAPYLRDRHVAHAAQARRLAVRAVPGRDADRQRDGLLREGDRARGRAGAVHPAHHLERRQLRLAGHDAGHPRDGAGRGPPARLVPRRPARVRGGRGPGIRAGRDRLRPHRVVGGGCSTPTAPTTSASG